MVVKITSRRVSARRNIPTNWERREWDGITYYFAAAIMAAECRHGYFLIIKGL
jgi:hypothetical protein